MLKAPPPNAPVSLSAPRVVRAGDFTSGPVLVCIGAQHGNEPSGVHAVRRVVATTHERKLNLRGAVIGLTANLAALRNRARFLEQDLNRMWTADRVHALTTGMVEDAFLEHLVAERHEQGQVIQVIDHILAEASGPVHFLDLHTTSAPSAPFCVVGDNLANRRFASHLPVTRILGLEEVLEGTITDYLNQLGHVAIAFEAGQHDDPLSIELHESAIWLAIAGAGILPSRDVPDLRVRRESLADASLGLPPIVEVRDHHRVTDGDGFRMDPGYDNFQKVSEGDRLAHDARLEYRASESGRIFMPLYQQLGEDGYFIVRPVTPGWMRLSAMLRCAGATRILRTLGAVSSDERLPQALVIDEARAGRWTWSLLHASGYRRGRRIGGRLYAARNLFDLGRGRHGPLVSCTNKPLRRRN